MDCVWTLWKESLGGIFSKEAFRNPQSSVVGIGSTPELLGARLKIGPFKGFVCITGEAGFFTWA